MIDRLVLLIVDDQFPCVTLAESAVLATSPNSWLLHYLILRDNYVVMMCTHSIIHQPVVTGAIYHARFISGS